MVSKERKIGVLTFHYSTNFGGVLQCLYLCNALRGLGFNNVEVVNLVPKEKRRLKLKD